MILPIGDQQYRSGQIAGRSEAPEGLSDGLLEARAATRHALHTNAVEDES
jgi:hypothetical protein